MIGDSSELINIIVLDTKKTKAGMFDPTVRFENSTNQPCAVKHDRGKYIMSRSFRFSQKDIDCKIRTYIYAQEKASPNVSVACREDFSFQKKLNQQIVLTVLKSSYTILRHDLYSARQPTTCVLQ